MISIVNRCFLIKLFLCYIYYNNYSSNSATKFLIRLELKDYYATN
jgi:hypothetical protein